eukprot:365296-Chlamydomonas_euryale.AAC.31
MTNDQNKEYWPPGNTASREPWSCACACELLTARPSIVNTITNAHVNVDAHDFFALWYSSM